MNNPQLLKRLRAEHADLAANGWNDVWLVLEGDWGGQIYLTVPWNLLGEDAKVLPLLKGLDREAWACNDGDGRQAYLYSPRERGQRTRGVAGGMGGGRLTDGIWLHHTFGYGWHQEARQLLGLEKSK